MTVKQRPSNPWWHQIVAVTMAALLVAGCGGPEDPSADPDTASTPADPSTQNDEGVAVDPPAESEPPTPETTEPSGPVLPDLLTAGAPGIQTGGEYVDPDGFRADVEISIYGPVGLDGDVADTLDLCPEEEIGGDGSRVADDIAQRGLKTDGAIAWAFEMTITSPDPEFLFPLTERLAESASSGAGGIPSLANTDLHPDYKVTRTCTVGADDSSASWLGFTMIAPVDESTPNNPDGKLPTVYDEPLRVRLEDPLCDLACPVGSSWAETPDTEHGPSGGGWGDNGWHFEFDLAPVAERFISIEEGGSLLD